MKTTHIIHAYVSSKLSDDEARRAVIDYIVDRFPDVYVKGQARVKADGTHKVVMQQFSSEVYDRMAEYIMGTIKHLLEMMTYDVEDKTDYQQGWNDCITNLMGNIDEILTGEMKEDDD